MEDQWHGAGEEMLSPGEDIRPFVFIFPD